MSRLPSHVLVFLLTGLMAIGGLGQTSVSVYLPAYRDPDWEALRGSIISSDQSVTAYTVFCADVAPRCQIAGDIPFVFTEGPSTLKYGGSASSEIAADLHCNLEGKTVATCTGSSSFGPGFREGSVKGPTHTVWTSTFTGQEVVWGALTLTTPGPAGTTNTDGSAVVTEGASPAASGAEQRMVVTWPAVSVGVMAAVFLLM